MSGDEGENKGELAADNPRNIPGLTEQEVRDLYGHSEPEDRQAVEEAVGILKKKLKPESLGDVFRRPAEVYDGRNLLEALGEDPHGTLQKIKDSFDWNYTG